MMHHSQGDLHLVPPETFRELREVLIEDILTYKLQQKRRKNAPPALCDFYKIWPKKERGGGGFHQDETFLCRKFGMLEKSPSNITYYSCYLVHLGLHLTAQRFVTA